MSFLIPKMPNTASPTSPLVSVQAEQARQNAATQAEKDAISGGRASTIHAGEAGTPLLGQPQRAARRSLGY